MVTRALKTTTQLALVALSKSVSAICGMFTLVSLVAWIRSEEKQRREPHVRHTLVTLLVVRELLLQRHPSLLLNTLIMLQ